MKLPFFHVLSEENYRQQLEVSYKEGYKTAWSCCYTGQYQRMTEDEKELKILELSHRNEVLTEKLLSLDHNMKDRQYYFGEASNLWRVFFSEKTPCAHCDFRFSCASKHWACADLAHYFRTGEVVELVREPTPGRYSVIFGLKLEGTRK